ncbi:MAG: ABC transporter substrate-binding protein, partial [Promicromonosporaceae bacterium]|nr:ABC transporter substrate-binding protein [Promicromonosporaceae bacterium]
TAPAPVAGPDGARRDVVIAVTVEPLNLDFTTTAGAAIPQLLLNNVYETLVKIDQDGTLIPLLATGWEVSADGLVYTFDLRPGVTFSDGRPFTAADVVASFDRTTDGSWTLRLAEPMAIIAATEALDEHTVQVTLLRPSNSWLFVLATSVGAIFPAELDFDLATEAIGTGPYTVAALHRGDRAVLTGRPDHWAGPAPLDQIAIRYIGNPASAVNALRAGDVDMLVNAATGDQVRQLMSDGGFQVLEGSSTGEVLLGFNNRRAPFDNVRVRQAFASAIDREAVVATVSAGFGQIVGTMVTPEDPFFEDLAGLHPFDPERAIALLAEAGYGPGLPGGPLHVTFDVPNIPYATMSAELIASQLADVGVEVTISILEFPGVWLDQVFQRHDFQMSVIMHVEARDLLTTISPDSYIGYDVPGVRALAEQADAGTFDEFVTGMRAVARQIAEDVPAFVLYLAPTLVVATPGLEGIRPNAVTESLDLTTLRWAD